MTATRFAYANAADSQLFHDAPPARVRPSIRLGERDTYQGVISDPISLHKYLYANANPVNGIDPTGRFTMVETLVATSIIVSIIAVICVIYGGHSASVAPRIITMNIYLNMTSTYAPATLNVHAVQAKLRTIMLSPTSLGGLSRDRVLINLDPGPPPVPLGWNNGGLKTHYVGTVQWVERVWGGGASTAGTGVPTQVAPSWYETQRAGRLDTDPWDWDWVWANMLAHEQFHNGAFGYNDEGGDVGNIRTGNQFAGIPGIVDAKYVDEFKDVVDVR